MPEREDEKLGYTTKELIEKLTEDPYFQYLIKEKARSQTRTFLVGVASLLLAVLAYGGWKFESVKSEIESAKIEVEKRKDQIAEDANDIKVKTEAASTLLKDTEKNHRNSEEAVKEMISRIQENITGSFSVQERLLKDQKSLIDDASKAAKASLGETDKKLEAAKARLGETDEKLKETEGLLDVLKKREPEIKTLADSAKEASETAERVTLNMQDKLSSLTSLDDVNRQLIKTQISELFLLNEKTSHTVNLPDSTNRLRYQITFSTRGIGKKITIHYEVSSIRYGDIELNNLGEFDWECPTQKRIDIQKTPFEAILTQRYYGWFSPEFVVIKVLLKVIDSSKRPLP